MGTELDLRDRPEGGSRRILFDELATVAVGETVEVVSDRDVDVHLVRYQIERERDLEWTYADPDEEPRELRVTKGEPLDGELGTIDVRDLKPQRRHEALLELFDELGAGEGFVLVNDHDPKPLYHELRSMHGDVVDWEYRSRGSDGWRVEVVKTDESEAENEEVVTRYDVREIPKAERHPTIHHRYGMIPEGGTLELVAPHEPQPLHREFRQRYGDAFTWDVVENERGRCRVHITKGSGPDGKTESSGPADAAEATGGTASGDGTSATESDDGTSATESDDGTSATESDDGASATGSDGETIEVVEELDVRDRPPAQRHEAIFQAYADLETGTGFVLVNDHDPKPLYHQFEAEAGPEFRWEYRQKEPGEFRVLIGRAERVDHDAGATREPADDTPEAPF